jgi:hypothetical protein
LHWDRKCQLNLMSKNQQCCVIVINNRNCTTSGYITKKQPEDNWIMLFGWDALTNRLKALPWLNIFISMPMITKDRLMYMNYRHARPLLTAKCRHLHIVRMAFSVSMSALPWFATAWPMHHEINQNSEVKFTRNSEYIQK